MQVEQRRIAVEDEVFLATWRVAPDDAESPSKTALGTFLFVHGLASNAVLWDMTALDLVRRGHQVAAVDLRGHGVSDKPDHGYDFETLVADIVHVSRSLGLERPILCGQSLGANLVLEAAWSNPDFARGVACIDGGTIELSRNLPDWDDVARVLAPPHLTGTKADLMRQMMRQAHPTWPQSGIDSSMANFEIRTDGTVTAQLSFENHMKLLHALWEHKPSECFAEMTVPVLLVMAGGSDGPPDKRKSVAIAEKIIPTVRVHWFEDADHDIHAQYPVELAELLDNQVKEGFFEADLA
jgi:pimeloyl-ACP methyl ester carboxylesterase